MSLPQHDDPISTSFAKMLLRSMANKVNMKFICLDDDSETRTLLCCFICEHFKNNSEDLRRYWVTQSMQMYATKVHTDIKVVFETYTQEEYDELGETRLRTTG